MKKYRHIFFDLDRTLWDFDRNSRETLTELFYRYSLDGRIGNPDDFVDAYHEINLQLWDLYRNGLMTKEILRTQRFIMSFDRFGIRDDAMAERFGEEYLELSPAKTILVPHASEILEYLSPAYGLHIITNGFQKTQQVKLKNCRLDRYFRSLTTSEEVGHNKPRPEIFQRALSSVNARKEESLMVGDDLEVDILGARRFGFDQVFLNREGLEHSEPVTYEIRTLLELKELL